MRRYNKELFKKIERAGLMGTYSELCQLPSDRLFEMGIEWNTSQTHREVSPYANALCCAVIREAYRTAYGKEKALRQA